MDCTALVFVYLVWSVYSMATGYMEQSPQHELHGSIVGWGHHHLSATFIPHRLGQLLQKRNTGLERPSTTAPDCSRTSDGAGRKRATFPVAVL